MGSPPGLVEVLVRIWFSSSSYWHPQCKSILWFNPLRLSDIYLRHNTNHYWFRFFACLAPSHHLNQCWNIVNWTFRNKLQWNINKNYNIFSQENVFISAVCETAAILPWSQCVNINEKRCNSFAHAMELHLFCIKLWYAYAIELHLLCIKLWYAYAMELHLLCIKLWYDYAIELHIFCIKPWHGLHFPQTQVT